MNVVEPIFDVVDVRYLNPTRSIAVSAASAPRLSTESTHLAYPLASRTERGKTGVFPFKNAFKSEQIPVDVQKTGVRQTECYVAKGDRFYNTLRCAFVPDFNLLFLCAADAVSASVPPAISAAISAAISTTTETTTASTIVYSDMRPFSYATV